MSVKLERRRILPKEPRSPDQVAGDMEAAAAKDAASMAGRIWPVKTGRSSPKADGPALVFGAGYAQHVRTQRGEPPLFTTKIPAIVKDAADVAREEYTQALAAATIPEG